MGNTIDSTKAPSEIQVGEKIILDPKKTRFVNLSASIFDNKLFILSGIDDSQTVGKDQIDVYSLYEGKYLGSFYIADSSGLGAREISFYHNKLFIVNGYDIISYTVE